jgi:hypothetical protein
MNLLKRSLPWLPLITIVCLGSAIAYYFMSDHYLRFTEEVQLASGELIVVDRKFKTEALGEIGGPGGWDAKFNSMVIIKPLRDGSPPIWQSDIGLIPILFDQDTQTKEWFVVTTFYMCDAWRKIGKPKLPYAEFRLRNGQWQQVDLSPQHIGRPANILTRISNKAELAHHTINTKMERMSAQGISPEYAKIVVESSFCKN